MCLITFALHVHPEYPLILVANRDEFFNRPTQKLQEWDQPVNIIAGKDITAGGTWLGLNKKGNLAAVTNFRDPNKIRNDAPSRGHLPVNFLSKNISAQNYLLNIKNESDRYNGFNLLLFDSQDLYHFSNVDKKITQVANGVHALSNALLNSPWPKVNRAKKLLENSIIRNEIDDEHLRALMTDKSLANENDLPQTGVPLSVEKQLSAMFIRMNGYGTRCTSVIKIAHNNQATFTEFTYSEKGDISSHQQLKIKMR